MSWQFAVPFKSFTSLFVEILSQFGYLSIPWISLIVLVCWGFQGACEIGKEIPSLESCWSCALLFGLMAVFAVLWKGCLVRPVVGGWDGRSTLGLFAISARPMDSAAAEGPSVSIFCFSWCRWMIWNTSNSDLRDCYFWSSSLTNGQETKHLLRYASWMTCWIWPVNWLMD